MTVSEAKNFVMSIYPEAKEYLLENGTYFIAIGTFPKGKFLCWEPAYCPESAWLKGAHEINEAMMYKLTH